MTLYIANPSHQNHRFLFRDPKNNLVQQLDIARGTQREIGHNWTAEQQRLVIQQLERFGARDAAEVHRPMGKFDGLLYRDRGVIEREEIELGNTAEVQTREDRAVSAAVKAGLAFDKVVRKGTSNRPPARVTEITVEQEVARGVHKTGNEVNFNLSVDPEGRSDVKLPV